MSSRVHGHDMKWSTSRRGLTRLLEFIEMETLRHCNKQVTNPQGFNTRVSYCRHNRETLWFVRPSIKQTLSQIINLPSILEIFSPHCGFILCPHITSDFPFWDVPKNFKASIFSKLYNKGVFPFLYPNTFCYILSFPPIRFFDQVQQRFYSFHAKPECKICLGLERVDRYFKEQKNNVKVWSTWHISHPNYSYAIIFRIGGKR